MTTFFSTIADRRARGTYDKLMELRAYDATALSATGSSTGVLAYPVKHEDFKVCLSVAAYTSYSAGVNEWAITVEVSDAIAGTYKVVGTLSPATSAGAAIETEIVLGGGQVASILSTAKYIRVTATKTGSPGNLTYGAWIVPCC